MAPHCDVLQHARPMSGPDNLTTSRAALRESGRSSLVSRFVGSIEDDGIQEGEPDQAILGPPDECRHQNAAFETDMNLRSRHEVGYMITQHATFGDVVNSEIGRRAID
jgi:hypothetical protein